MNKQQHKGFTLIELLVVVAIIAILATTILASLGAARSKARLARIQSEISSMRAAAELTTGTTGTYPTTLFTDAPSGMANLVTDVETAFPSATSKGTDGGSWAFSVNYDGAKHFCADSTGFAGETTAAASLKSTGGWSCK